MKNKFELTTKNYKTFETRSGGGYNCTVYINGESFCHAHDAGRGGCIEYQPVEATADATKKMREEIKRCEKHYRELPEFARYKDSVELFDLVLAHILTMVEVEKEEKRLKKLMKRRILYTTSKSKAGEFFKTTEFKTPVDLQTGKTHLREELPDCVFLDEGDNLKKFLAAIE